MNLLQEIENLFPTIESMFDTESIAQFTNISYSELFEYHFSLGVFIRNNILVENTSIVLQFKSVNVTDKDDMSSLIVSLFYIHIQEKYH